MRLPLRRHTFDLTTRALVMTVAGDGAVPDGADLLEVTGASAGPSGAPLCIRTEDAGQLDERYDLVLVPTPHVDGKLIEVAAGLELAVVITAPLGLAPVDVCDHLVACARTLEQAGVPNERIVVSAGAHREPQTLRATTQLASLGHALLVDLEPWASDDLLGAASLAVIRGARILRTPAAHTRAARRVADTVAAILEAA